MVSPHTLQQNGVVERQNRAIMDMVRCMIDDASLSKTFWAEAAKTTVYLLNRVPTATLDGVTPQEAWSGNKPCISHLRVFECKASMHIPKKQRTKLDMKSKKLIFLGYTDEALGYRLMDPRTRRVYTSRDIEFIEKKEVDAPSIHSHDEKIIPTVKTEDGNHFDNDNDDGEDGEIQPPTGTAKSMPKWYTSMMRDAKLDSAPDTFTTGMRTSGMARNEVNLALMGKVVETTEPSIVLEALQSKPWKDAMDAKYKSLMKNNT